MVKRITDTAEPCRPYCLNLPTAYKRAFSRIDDKSRSAAARRLLEYAVAMGALPALSATTISHAPRVNGPDVVPYQPYSLNLPEFYATLFAGITSRSASTACRLLIDYALAHGALEALAPSPTAADVFAAWNNEE